MKNMKPLIAIIACCLLSGCISPAPCQYCRETKEPDVEQNEQIDIGDGLYKCVATKKWIRIQIRATKTDWEIWRNK
jgi:hypothetical protein